MNMSDRLRFLQFSKQDIDQVRQVIKHAWGQGIQNECNYYGAHEFQLRGHPWMGQGTDAIPSRQLMCGVLASLYHSGWVLQASTDISKKNLAKDTLLFRFQSPPPLPCTWFSISFNKLDRLRLIGAPNEVIEHVARMLGPLLQKRSWKQPGAYEFKLKGYPWLADGEETVSTRILLRLLEILENNGFSLYASINQNTGTQGKHSTSETDSWYCRRQISWVPGAPVFH